MEKILHHYRSILIGIMIVVMAGILYVVVRNAYFSTKRPEISFAKEIVWTGAAGDGSWDSPENWSTKTVPSALDAVSVDNATVTIVSSSAVSFDKLYIGKGGVTNVILEGTIADGAAIEVGENGSLIQKNNQEQILSDALVVKSGGTLTHAPNMALSEFGVRFAAHTITIDFGGAVKADRLGFSPGSSGPGAGGSSPDGAGGGGHGGKGGDGVGALGGAAYCSFDKDMQMGSGGGNGSLESSGAGGGLIVLKASETLTINGKITAEGYAGTSYNAGGGAGGGILLIARSIDGIPEEISAHGGDGNKNGGGGGGGCVVVKFVENSSVSENTVKVHGGNAEFQESVNASDSSVPSSSGAVSSSGTIQTPQPEFPATSSSSSDIVPSSSSTDSSSDKKEQPVGGDEVVVPAPALQTNSSTPAIAVPIITSFPGKYSLAIIGKGEQGKVFIQRVAENELPVIPLKKKNGALGEARVENTASSSLKINAAPTSTPNLVSTTTFNFSTSTGHLLEPLTTGSAVEFLTLPKSGLFQAGETMSLTFSVLNKQVNSQRFKVVRQILDERSKVLISKESSVALKPKQSFVYEVSQKFPLSLASGSYVYKVIVFDQKGIEFDMNAFRFMVK